MSSEGGGRQRWDPIGFYLARGLQTEMLQIEGSSHLPLYHDTQLPEHFLQREPSGRLIGPLKSRPGEILMLPTSRRLVRDVR